MPATRFICPDKQTIAISNCLAPQGCRMNERCATVPYLRHIAKQRPFVKVTPSAAGNGARYIYLKAIHEYAIDPYAMTWAVLGTAAHELLSNREIVDNVFEEMPLSHDAMEGIPDVLERDEFNAGSYILTDYKTFGSYKVAKCLGIEKIQQALRDSDGRVVTFKSGKNKGNPKMISVFTHTGTRDIKNEMLQLNCYRIMYEAAGFPVSRMNLQVIVRDGATYIAKSRGIKENMYLIDIPRMKDGEVLGYYKALQSAVSDALITGWAPKCSAEESWDGRRCKGYCDVAKQCAEMPEFEEVRDGQCVASH